MITVREIDNTDTVRALSEHRAPRKVLNAAPLRAFQPVPRAPAAYEDLLIAPLPTKIARAPRHYSFDGLEKLRATGLEEFTLHDLAETAGIKLRTASIDLQEFSRRKLIRRAGKDGRAIIWKFTQEKL